MKTQSILRRWAPLSLLLVCIVAVTPGVALAEHHDREHHDREHHDGEHHDRGHHDRDEHDRGHRPNTSVFFGLRVSNAPPVCYVPAPRYCPIAPRCGEETYYYDPYCRQRFPSLAIYIGHLHHHRHPAVIRVMDEYDDEPIYAYRYRDDGWVRDDD